MGRIGNAVCSDLIDSTVGVRAETPDPEQLAKLIDQRLDERFAAENVTPALQAEDAEVSTSASGSGRCHSFSGDSSGLHQRPGCQQA